MKRFDLSVLIAGRNEMFFKRTIDDVLKNSRGNTEVIAVFDGGWADPQIPDNPRVTIIYNHKAVGQRAAVNQAARVSKSKYVMKLDAHCAMDEGFDVKLMADCEPNWTVVPRLYNLHAFDWVCVKCKKTIYQGPTPTKCPDCGDKMERQMIWKPRLNRRSDFMRFDSDMHFQYWGDYGSREEAKGDICDVMGNLGACYFMHRDWYWDIGGLDENHGSWGQMGTEISCKTWLRGGRQVVNKKTWYSHMFRTQGGDFGFPYPLTGRETDAARKYSQDLWKNDKWDRAVRPLSWLIEKFAPVPGWNQNQNVKSHTGDFTKGKKLTKGIIYYTDNQLNLKIAHACKKNIKSMGLPIFSASLKPMPDMGVNTVLPLKRGYITMFKQILAALESCTTDIVYFCEHDWLYNKSHFEFTPEKKDVYYYNDNWLRVRVPDGHAVFYDTHLLPGICAFRETLLNHYRKRVEKCEKEGFKMAMGFEPGTHHRKERIDDLKAESWKSRDPIIDLRHNSNLTASKWSPDEFRDLRNCKGWIESNRIDILKEHKII